MDTLNFVEFFWNSSINILFDYTNLNFSIIILSFEYVSKNTCIKMYLLSSKAAFCCWSNWNWIRTKLLFFYFFGWSNWNGICIRYFHWFYIWWFFIWFTKIIKIMLQIIVFGSGIMQTLDLNIVLSKIKSC